MWCRAGTALTAAVHCPGRQRSPGFDGTPRVKMTFQCTVVTALLPERVTHGFIVTLYRPSDMQDPTYERV